MDDRELLELAAKSVGRKIKYNYFGNQDCRNSWYPLDDDGEALLLAIQLGLSITPHNKNMWMPPHVVVSCVVSPICKSFWVEEYNGDEMAAVRRAIVRAAADLAENLPRPGGR